MTSPTQELPRYKVVPVPQPAAGAELVINMTGIGAWLIMSLVFDLQTSAVVANRLVDILATDSTTTWFRAQASAVQAASLTQHYAAFTGSSGQPAAGNSITLDFMADGLYLPAGSQLRTQTQNIDVADQYLNIGMLVIEYPTGPDYLIFPMPEYYVEPKG